MCPAVGRAVTRPEAAGPGEPVGVSGGSVRILTLQRPATLNALDEELHTHLLAALDSIAADDDVRAVVLTGTGRAFSAGGDTGLIRRMQEDRRLRRETLDTGRRLFDRFANLSVPVIAAVNGAAVGAGCTLALMCDVVFMADDTYLSDPHIMIGLVPGDGGVVLWPLLGGLPAARAYLLTGDRVPAAEALRLGLVYGVVGPDVVRATALAFAERIATLPTNAVRATKRALNAHLRLAAAIAFDGALDAEDRAFDSTEHRELTGDHSNATASGHRD
jgi:enoyl-CoA hydratase